jgi:uncharacterized protein (TIGR02594 family)
MKYLVLILALAGCSNSLFVSRVIPPYVPVDTAASMVGMHEQTSRKELRQFLGVDPISTPWCAAFVNSVLRTHNIKGSESVSRHPLLARSFLRWGTPVSEPQLGDVVVFERNNTGWQGHVGFYAGYTNNDGVLSYTVLGGNQDDEVAYRSYPASKLLGIRRIP